MPHTATGVDCHKDPHVVAFLDPLGRVLGTLRVGQTAEEYAHAVEAAYALGAAPGEVRWGLESTGSYGRRFANRLAAAGEVVYEVPSALTHRSRRNGPRLGKSDAIDAQAIAEVVLRVNHRGDRQLNRLLHIIALVHIRFATHPGRLYYQRKPQEGKTPRAALGALKRRLATVVYYRLVADTAALGEPPNPPAAALLAD